MIDERMTAFEIAANDRFEAHSCTLDIPERRAAYGLPKAAGPESTNHVDRRYMNEGRLPLQITPKRV